VAITTAFLASCVSSPTFTVFGETNVPVPLIHVTLFFLNKNSTPLEFWALTARDRFIAG